MGLGERKAVAAVKEGDFKQFMAKAKDACGYDVKLTFDWAAVENHKECMWICDNKKYNSYMFDRVLAALQAVASDDMGKTALKEKLKEVKMIPEAGDVDFANGVLTVRNDLTGNGAYDSDHIKSELEKGL